MMTTATRERITCWCVEVADSERGQLLAAFARHPELEPRLLAGPLDQHLDHLRRADVLAVFIESHVTGELL